MMEYVVTIRETLERRVTVVAQNEHEARDLVERQWKNVEHVLGSEDFERVEFEVCCDTN